MLQVVINEILHAWGREGLETHLKRMQSEYQQRAAVIQRAAGKLQVDCVHAYTAQMHWRFWQ